MKKWSFGLLSLFVMTSISAQVMGNYWQSNQSSAPVQGNYGIDIRQNSVQQFRAVPKNAVLLGENVLEFTINALSNQQADSYVAIFNLVQVGKTADETNTLMNTRINGFVSGLKALGIPDVDIYIDMVNFVPKYEYDVTKKLFSKKNYTETPKGFELQKNVHVRYKKANILDDIVTAAAKNEVFDIVKVDYFVNDPQKVYQELRRKTFEYLKEVEANYRGVLPIDSAYVITAENAWVAYPPNRYESYQVFCTQNLDVDKSSVVINSAEKTTSRFYNAIAGNDYDIVLNPEILEPAVQFSYSLIVRMTLPERRPQVQVQVVQRKEFMLLTPTGEVKQLKIE